MFFRSHKAADLEIRVTALSLAVAEIRQTLAGLGETRMRAKLEELAEELESLRRSNRREFGKLWKDKRDEPEQPDAFDTVPSGDAFQAHRDLIQQYSTPIKRG